MKTVTQSALAKRLRVTQAFLDAAEGFGPAEDVQLTRRDARWTLSASERSARQLPAGGLPLDDRAPAADVDLSRRV